MSKKIKSTVLRPENTTPDAMKAAIAKLEGKPLPVSAAVGDRSVAGRVGWVTLSYDAREGVQAEIELLDTPKGRAIREAIENQAPRMGFGIAGKVVEREGDVITEMEIDGIDFVTGSRT